MLMQQAAASADANRLPEMMDYSMKFPSDKLGVFGTIIVIFTYNVLLDRDLRCTCKPQNYECNLYMTLPFFIIFFLMLWLDKKFQRTWKFTCSQQCRCCSIQWYKRCCCGRFCLVIIRRIIKAALVGLLWVASLYIDGDWYVCCKNDQSELQIQLACKDKKTPEQQRIIAELKNWSKVIGFFILFVIILVAVLLSSFNWRKCGEGCQSCGTESGCCDRKVKKDKLILEETEKIRKEILREEARKEVEERLEGEDWTECFYVAEELINTQPERATTGERLHLLSSRPHPRVY